jgi:hypothetical protein
MCAIDRLLRAPAWAFFTLRFAAATCAFVAMRHLLVVVVSSSWSRRRGLVVVVSGSTYPDDLERNSCGRN